ncbi:MAG: diguanylate cyclase [Porticoccaceae bacterium]
MSSPPPTLDGILHRQDVWRGRRHQGMPHTGVDSGYALLNAELLHGGWPRGTLIEICQKPFQGDWQLFLPALRVHNQGVIALLNPPAQPFSQAFIQANIDLERLLVINAPDNADFLHCFSEMARSDDCAAMLAWQPRKGLSYSNLRKCLLAATLSNAIHALFRPWAAQRESSPAALRISTKYIDNELEFFIFKQKGILRSRQPQPVRLPLPECWQAAQPYCALDHSDIARNQSAGASALNLKAGT